MIDVVENKERSNFARRAAARLLATQALYQHEMAPCEANDLIAEFLQMRSGHDIDDEKYIRASPKLFESIVRGVIEQKAELLSMLQTKIQKEITFEQFDALLKIILIAGIFEIIHHQDVPAPILLSEYVDITSAFYGGKEPHMVNAILNGFVLERTKSGNS